MDDCGEVPHNRLCKLHMRGIAHARNCPRVHAPKECRPACPVFAKHNQCPFDDGCFYPHRYTASLHPDANMALLVPSSHADRLRDYVNVILRDGVGEKPVHLGDSSYLRVPKIAL